jgi:hypothetical protein
MPIDQEIHEIEQRMARRRHDVAQAARAAKERAVHKVVSPLGLAIAAAIGFLATAAFLRKPRVKVVERRHSPRKAGKLAGAASLLMPVALGVLRSQFGGPGEMAQAVLSKVKKRQPPGRAPVA